MAESDDDKRKRSWMEAQNRLAPGETPIDRMLSDMAWTKTGWHRARGEDGCVSVVLPETAKDESEWEQRSLLMLDQQQPIELPSKPLERTRMRSAVASFDVVHGDTAEGEAAPRQRQLKVPKFHETSPASTEVMRRTIERGS